MIVHYILSLPFLSPSHRYYIFLIRALNKESTHPSLSYSARLSATTHRSSMKPILLHLSPLQTIPTLPLLDNHNILLPPNLQFLPHRPLPCRLQRPIPTLIPARRLNRLWRRPQPALKDIIRNPNPQRNPPNREQLPGPIRPRAHRRIPHRITSLIIRRPIRLHTHRIEDVFGGKGVEAPVYPQKDAGERGVEHRVPESFEVARHEGADCAELGCYWQGGVVGVSEIAGDSV